MATFNWKKPVEILVDKGIVSGTVDRLEDSHGLYFFSRKYGDGPHEPFYVGETVHIKTRLCQYFNNMGKHEKRIRNVILGEYDDYSAVRV